MLLAESGKPNMRTETRDSPKFILRLKQSIVRRKQSFLAGSVLAIFGIFALLYSVRPTLGYEQVYFFWSFVYVYPLTSPPLPPEVIQPGGPAMASTFEVLMPWLIIGVVALSTGLFFLFRKTIKS